MCGGAGGGGAAPQSRAAPLPAAINSRPAQHVPAAAAAGAPGGAAVPSRRVARPERDALSRAGTRSSCLPKPRWRGRDPPPCFPLAFAGAGCVPGTEDGAGLRTPPPVPLGSSDRASPAPPRRWLMAPVPVAAAAVTPRPAWQGGEGRAGAVAHAAAHACGTREGCPCGHLLTQVSVSHPSSLSCFYLQQMLR
ncbi:skin secretory protein xP2-like [Falco peregrinus]|uniref:skin secretory protein xP2-like n=1 Tax=Falco peregrinus TaxID=8954 RepID=UPI00247ADBCA|nr:skin secretory protein xP2-like [Falco peregrinus]